MGENEVQQEQGPATIFPNAGEFVHSWLLQVMNRKVNSRDTFWCAQWWKHPEAVCRLTALWLSWEASREDRRVFRRGGVTTWITTCRC